MKNFYPRPPRGGRRQAHRPGVLPHRFLSTPSARRATGLFSKLFQPLVISIHALREEGDPALDGYQPAGRRDFYPRPPRGGRRFRLPGGNHSVVISIHALREEGDSSKLVEHRSPKPFLSTPSARRATLFSAVGFGGCGFLSTPSARRATCTLFLLYNLIAISIHALREEGDDSPIYDKAEKNISIHALREEGDPAGILMVNVSLAFLSTPSARRATRTHGSHFILNGDFYPRPPRGGRPYALPSLYSTALFLSTPSARRATSGLQRYCPECANFYPRPPRGGRHCMPTRLQDAIRISIHALREEGDRAARSAGDTIWLFLSTPSARRATSVLDRDLLRHNDFYPRPPRGGRLGVLLLGNQLRIFLSTPSARRATTLAAH